MNFREQVIRDMGAILEGEFAESIDYDGVPIQGILQNAGTASLAESSRVEEPWRGLYERTSVLYAKATDFPELPVSGERVSLNGRPFVVRDVESTWGTVRLLLEANEA